MAEMVITELRRTGSGVEPTLVEFRWSSSTHSSMTNPLSVQLKINTMRRTPNGAERPVEQVMSSSWEPFDVSGEWNDKWAGRGFAAQMMLEFPRLVGRTPLVRFRIDRESIVGLITSYKPTYVTRDRVGYLFTISPHINEAVGSFQQSVNKVPPQPINARIDRAAFDVQELLDQSDAALPLPAKNRDVEDSRIQLQEASSAVDKLRAAGVLSIGSTIDASLATVADSTSKTERSLLVLASSFRRLRGAVQNTMDTVARKRSDLTVGFDDAISILRFDEWRCATTRQAAQTLGTSSAAEQDMRALASRRPRAIHFAKKGENLERISLRYYGTADNWRAIYDANNLDSILLDGGAQLLIPERTS
jgi:hypothetical protein